MNGPDLSSLTSIINLSSVVLAIISVASALAAVYVIKKGVIMILDAIRSSDSQSWYDDEMRDLVRRGFSRDQLREQGWDDDDFKRYGFKDF